MRKLINDCIDVLALSAFIAMLACAVAGVGFLVMAP